MPWLYDVTIKYEKDGEVNEHETQVTTTSSAVSVMHELIHGVMPVDGAGLTISVRPRQRAGGLDGVSQLTPEGMGLILAPEFMEEEEGEDAEA